MSALLWFLAILAAAAWWVYARYLRDLEPGVLEYIRLMFWFRGKNLVKFMDDHERLFQEAKKCGDHIQCTSHWYDMMSDLVASFYGQSFHFAAPAYVGQRNSQAIVELHATLARLMHLAPGMHALDLGCGVGGLTRDLARYSGANVWGITSGAEEVEMGNALHKSLGLGSLCKSIQGDMQKLPFEDNTFDAVYGVYTLKYLTTLDRVMTEVLRVLKPGGQFLVYCMMKSDTYDNENPEHRKIFEGFEYSCGMPTMHSVPETIVVAKKTGYELLTKMELSHGNQQWHAVFTDNLFLRWVLSSSLVDVALRALDGTLLPKGFHRFMQVFVANNVLSIQHAGATGIMTGSEVLIFRKPASN
eukprot:m51a1_g2605 putative sterol 24-c-methyltransferase (358) ;mRNA; r:470077-471624